MMAVLSIPRYIGYPVEVPDGLSGEDRARIRSAAVAAGKLATDLKLQAKITNGSILTFRFDRGAWRPA